MTASRKINQTNQTNQRIRPNENENAKPQRETTRKNTHTGYWQETIAKATIRDTVSTSGLMLEAVKPRNRFKAIFS